MRSFSILLLCLCLAAPMARAQTLIAEYFTLIGPADLYNSSGVRLGDFGAILQQDRANFHRFGRRDELDGWDPIFADQSQRARIPQIWQIAPGSEYIPGWVLSGQSRYLWIRVFGSGGIPQVMLISEGAG
jgi:hypothetical protein